MIETPEYEVHYGIYDAGWGYAWECLIEGAELECSTYFDEEEDAEADAKKVIGDWLSDNATAASLS
jgi:hypothetical protein